ncbi:hypothetical protein [Rhizobium herbae]|uniref:Uncharacterized protein n=1 Tax=Rhizobium herbae TaxID=508661 RepID=A0ABS4ENY7_9HYPH|nr:hypothetical protein [Rhizobium herbae]MBP1859638.1 hypothetical protein [Rhizobium herbae]
MRLIAFVTSALLMLSTMPAQAADAVNVPGTSWSIEPPPEFTLTRDPITMFIHPSKAAMMIMQSEPTPLKLSDLGEVGSMQGEGENVARMDEMREMTIGGRHALYFKGYMTLRNSHIVSVSIQGAKSNGMVIAVIPANAASLVNQAAIEASLLTAREVDQTIDQRAEALPYRFDDLAGMRIAEIVMGSVAIITDGPGSDMGGALDQLFAMVFVGDADGQSDMSAEGDGDKVRGQIAEQYPDAEFLETTVRDTTRGRVLEVTYTRKDKATNKTLGGIAWFRIDNGKGILMIAQHPITGFHYDRLASIRDGISIK